MKIAVSLGESSFKTLSNYINTDNSSMDSIIRNLDDYQVLIIESTLENLDSILENLKYNGCKVILWGIDLKACKLRNYFKSNLIYDYVDSFSHYNLIGILKKVEGEITRDIVAISDTNQELFISMNKLNYITYDRLSRKTILNCSDKHISLTKKLSELESSLSKFGNFVKADRSTIVNINLIESINYKTESVSFIGGGMISLSKNKLKELREYVPTAN